MLDYSQFDQKRAILLLRYIQIAGKNQKPHRMPVERQNGVWSMFTPSEFTIEMRKINPDTFITHAELDGKIGGFGEGKLRCEI